ncbi:hypothetical protein DXG03_001765, partial [Asterophora parasitica]
RAAPRGLGLSLPGLKTPARVGKPAPSPPRAGVKAKGVKVLAVISNSPPSPTEHLTSARVAISSPTLLARTHEAYGPELWTRSARPTKSASSTPNAGTSTPPREHLRPQASSPRATPPMKTVITCPKGTTATPSPAASTLRSRPGRAGVPAAHLSSVHNKISGKLTDTRKTTMSPPSAVAVTSPGRDRPVSRPAPALPASTRQPLSQETQFALRSRVRSTPRPRIPHGEVSKMPVIIVRPASENFSVEACPSPSPSEGSTVEEADTNGLSPGWKPKVDHVKEAKRGTALAKKPLRDRTNEDKAPWRGTSVTVEIPTTPVKKTTTRSQTTQASASSKTRGEENVAPAPRGRKRANTTIRRPQVDARDAHVPGATTADAEQASDSLATTETQASLKDSSPDFSAPPPTIKDDAAVCFVPEELATIDTSVAVDVSGDASPTLATSPERTETPELCSPLACFAETLSLLLEATAHEDPPATCSPEGSTPQDAPTRVRLSGGIRPLLLSDRLSLEKALPKAPAPEPPRSRPASIVSKPGLRPFLLQAAGSATPSPSPPLSAVRRGWLRLTAACSRSRTPNKGGAL